LTVDFDPLQRRYGNGEARGGTRTLKREKRVTPSTGITWVCIQMEQRKRQFRTNAFDSWESGKAGRPAPLAALSAGQIYGALARSVKSGHLVISEAKALPVQGSAYH